MDRDRWERVQLLFHEAADLPAGERRAFLGGICEFGASEGKPIADDAMVLTRELPEGFGVRSGLALKNALRDQAIGQHRVIHQAHRTWALDDEGDDRRREHHCVPQCQHGQFLGDDHVSVVRAVAGAFPFQTFSQ